MTVFGKILTFVILVLALAQAGLQVMFHIESVKHASRNEELAKKVEAANGSIDSLVNDKTASVKEREELTNELRAALLAYVDARGKAENRKPDEITTEQAEITRASLKALRDKMKGSLDGSTNDLAKQQQRITDLTTQMTALNDKHRDELRKLADSNLDTLSSREIVVKLNDRITENNLRIRDLHETNNQLRDEAVKKNVLAKDLQFRNEQLVAQLKESEIEMGKLRARLVSPGGGFGGPVPVAGGGNIPGGQGPAVPGVPGGGGGGAGAMRNAPNDNLEGQVMKTDPQGFMTLSLGTDSGLAVGHTLEVFRLNPPKYLGTVRIMTAKPNEAVAKPIGRPLGPIAPGDRVASKILGG